MRKLFHLAGRAWSFITSQLEGEHFVISNSAHVPQFLEEAQELAKYGQLKSFVKDVDSCFPSMPREAIRFGLRNETTRLKQKHGYEGVIIPKFCDSKPCKWMKQTPIRYTRQGAHKAQNIAEDKRYVNLSFATLLDIMEFALDNAIIKMPNGTLLRQVQGIPMGDPISPGMTIGTLAWMENEWMAQIHPTDKKYFKGARYMDDVLVFYADNPNWDAARFCTDFSESTCYHPPLKLVEGTDGTFLETRFTIEQNKIKHWLKNDNENQLKVWRYQHFHSHGPYLQKRALLTTCLKKVHKMASDAQLLETSGLAKVKEFLDLKYPRCVVKAACGYMAATTGERTWLNVRDQI
jgi:hypothetical protein